MLRFATSAAVITIFANTVPPVLAQEAEVEAVRPSEIRTSLTEYAGSDAARSAARARKGRPWRSGGAQPAPRSYIVDVEVRVNPASGGPCAYVFMVEGDPNSAEAASNESMAMELAGRLGTCSNSPRQPGGGLTPAAAAALLWQDSVELPDPMLQIKPGYAITGKPAYLEINSPRAVREQRTAFGHTVELTVTSVLDIDWGDGTIEKNITRSGGAWPSGDITHVFTRTEGAMPVKVTQRWQATWRVGNQAGRITDQLFTESTMALEVRQLQAVRDR